MEDQRGAPQRRVKRRRFTGLLPLIIIVLVLLAAASYFLLPRYRHIFDNVSYQTDTVTPDSQPQTVQTPPTGPTASSESVTLAKEPLVSETDIPSPQRSETQEPNEPSDSAAGNGDQTPGSRTDVDADIVRKADELESFFLRLDDRDYIKTFNLGAPSNAYFPALIQRLVDNPPVVTGETEDLFTILQNTAHFFRIIGKDNILILKGILDRERETFEQTLADFYDLTKEPEYLQERFNLEVPPDSLYLYSGFFLNTMGGRLYLFRRDSMSRMVVSFYAIKILETANRQGRNKYGIEIKSAINNLIDEIESSRIDLKLRDYYLDYLYELKEKYQ